MSVESTRAVMMKYFDSKHTDVSMMADDVVFTMMANGQETKTPQGVLQMLNYFYHIAFDAGAEIRNLLFDDGKALVEGNVIGKHIGEFAGIGATGKDINVPIAIIYDLENDQIKRARIYFEMPVLMEQLGVTVGQQQTT
jgi:steroid delta-isomerase-like uncharacterized protein